MSCRILRLIAPDRERRQTTLIKASAKPKLIIPTATDANDSERVAADALVLFHAHTAWTTTFNNLYAWQPPTSIMLSMPQKYQNLEEHSLILEIFLQSQARRFLRAPPCTHTIQNHCFRHQSLAQRGTTKFSQDNLRVQVDRQCLFAGTKAPLSMAPLSRERVRVFGTESRK